MNARIARLLPIAAMAVCLAPAHAATFTAELEPIYTFCPGEFTGVPYFGPILCPGPAGEKGPLDVTLKPAAGELPYTEQNGAYGYDARLYVVARYAGQLYSYQTSAGFDIAGGWPWQWQALPTGSAIPASGPVWRLTTGVPSWPTLDDGIPRSAFSDGSASQLFTIYLGNEGHVSQYLELKGLHIYAGLKAPGTVVRSTDALLEVWSTSDQ